MTDVTICIPAWQAADFIDRTLACARAQTHAAIRILVSVDQCTDDTVARCRAHAAQDTRIVVIEQQRRLGWSGNANALLDRVDTDFFFLYFHDDVIEPTYTATLLAALRAEPAAMSAHCTMERFGEQTGLLRSQPYSHSLPRRLLEFFVGPEKGSPLRSLVRSCMLDRGLRFPVIGSDGFWRCHPFLVQLIGTAPTAAVDAALYRRWFREGSLTTHWHAMSLDTLLDGQRESARLALDFIDAQPLDADARHQVLYGAMLFYQSWTQRYARKNGHRNAIAPGDISPRFAGLQAPCDVDATLESWFEAERTQIRRLGGLA